MKIKVCGMKIPENIHSLSELPIDFMGMIFYTKSPRFVENLNPDDLSVLPKHIKKVGVFVNAEIDFLSEKITHYKLDLLQLHGNESVEYCKIVKKEFNLPIIKVFNVSEAYDFEQAETYIEVCDYFLFDTKTPQHGGSGQKFDWSILNAYQTEKPFFLSGGISDKDIDTIQKINHPHLYALDLNSKFEVEAGLKNIELIKQFIKDLKL